MYYCRYRTREADIHERIRLKYQNLRFRTRRSMASMGRLCSSPAGPWTNFGFLGPIIGTESREYSIPQLPANLNPSERLPRHLAN